MLREGGLEPLEPFTKPNAWRLTRCLACGLEAHYRFEYTREKNALGQRTCRSCHWRQWALEVRQVKEAPASPAPATASQAREHAEKHGYDYLGPLSDPSLLEDPHHVRCRYCGRLSAERMDDITFGCTCQTNPRRDRQTSTASGRAEQAKTRDLLKDSGLPVVDWWDHETNESAAWETVTLTARREVSWRCPDCGLQFMQKVSRMIASRECPSCEPKQRAAWHAQHERYKVTPVADVPELLTAWADDADPRTVTVAAFGPGYRFRCPHGHHPRLSPFRYLTAGCPSCRRQDTLKEHLAAIEVDPTAFALPAEIASQWHPTKNGGRQAATVSPGSRKTAWWRDPNCGHEWQDTPAQREKGQRLRCPECRTILDSLAYHFPELAAEWAPTNPRTAWQIRPTGQTPFIPAWICSTNTDHTWRTSLASRASGSSCPQCRQHGKSRIELDHHAAAERVFGRATSGQSVRHDAFKRHTHWLVDITVELATGRTLIIEYDGSYWHADKHETDLEKSQDLLSAGYLLARLREHPLTPLQINNPAYAEFIVHSTAPTPDATIERVKRWATSQSSPAP